ncbi:hypothetical protein [Carboxylicivirga sp. N1Y90]|uniref:hypothetical protein n=1 Tax=Carboxylicivirga fragile TaxID=3417571 RepID=UPI003D35628F|nr:hypothetical protein [Marinilabiliaceae bacterium N1Y90]
MLEENKILEIILSDFPNCKKEIEILFDESSNFIEICEDYILCKNSIEDMEAQNNKNLEKEIYDLRLLLSELKMELLSKTDKLILNIKKL